MSFIYLAQYLLFASPIVSADSISIASLIASYKFKMISVIGHLIFSRQLTISTLAFFSLDTTRGLRVLFKNCFGFVFNFLFIVAISTLFTSKLYTLDTIISHVFCDRSQMLAVYIIQLDNFVSDFDGIRMKFVPEYIIKHFVHVKSSLPFLYIKAI